MSRILRYLTHPQVQIDPSVPVPEWGLSEVGHARAALFASLPILRSTRVIVSSAETKAIETAKAVSDVINVPVRIRERTHENDRSATGFLEPEEFERVADRFFEAPEESVRGWERAVDAQARISQEAARIIKDNPEGDLLMVGHGGVGTLLYCQLAALEISRQHDQPAGGGNVFSYDLNSKTIGHSWRSIEQVSLAAS
ncbi:MAG: histidine phosphatase family protein [Pseudomonadota bacterium]